MGDNRDSGFTIWVNSQSRGSGHLGTTGAVLKLGPKVCKTVTVSEYGDTESGEVRKRELCFRTAPQDLAGPGYDFNNPTVRWSCENEEIDRLLAFLHGDVAEAGRYRVIDMLSPSAALLDLLEHGDVAAEELVDVLTARGDLAAVVQAITATEGGLSAAESAVMARRRALVAELQQLVLDPRTTETQVQARIGDAHWLFGGRYVGVAERRNLAILDQHDIPLLGADGTLHIVELKGPNAPRLVRRHRNHCIVGNDVHEATSQAINYLRTLDDLGASLETVYRNELGHEYDMRRVFATVVIGHPGHVPNVEERVIDQTIRTYNASLSRVEVITYKALLDAAERALAFEEASRGSATG